MRLVLVVIILYKVSFYSYPSFHPTTQAKKPPPPSMAELFPTPDAEQGKCWNPHGSSSCDSDDIFDDVFV